MSKSTYGSPRIFHELRSEGFSVSENTVAKYMRGD
ncbi:MAG: transposase, partial [Bdellovibrionales bacterium]|nr:transposase [Bdellovibrionales bacterium]